MNYSITTTPVFDKWLNKLKNRTVKNKVLARLARIEVGNFGDHKSLADGLFELRFHFASGIRVYYTINGQEVVILINGGDKSTQSNDIVKAKKVLSELE